MAKKTSYTKESLADAGAETALQVLIEAAGRRERITYGSLARILETSLGIPKIFGVHIGYVVGALMERLEKLDKAIPLINAIVVEAQHWKPSEGVDSFLRRRFKVKGVLRGERRDRYIEAATYEVWSYDGWEKVFRKLFGKKLPETEIVDVASDFEPDGQGDNPIYGRGGESPEHRALKEYVRAHPDFLRLGLQSSDGQTERFLLSGDRLDVEFLNKRRWVAVEVKSMKSGDADFRRGIYQCVKYRAVMTAQVDAEVTPAAEVKVVMVTESKLSAELATLARLLKVKTAVIVVNK